MASQHQFHWVFILYFRQRQHQQQQRTHARLKPNNVPLLVATTSSVHNNTEIPCRQRQRDRCGCGHGAAVVGAGGLITSASHRTGRHDQHTRQLTVVVVKTVKHSICNYHAMPRQRDVRTNIKHVVSLQHIHMCGNMSGVFVW